MEPPPFAADGTAQGEVELARRDRLRRPTAGVVVVPASRLECQAQGTVEPVRATSFLVALERETARGEQGPARSFLPSLRGRRLVISIVSVEELLEGAVDEATALASLQRFAIQALQLAQARRCALLQRRAARRLGENDAWLVATAASIGAEVVAADRAAFQRLGTRHVRFR